MSDQIRPKVSSVHFQMKRCRTLVVCCLLLLTASVRAQKMERALAFTHVTVIDATGSDALRDMTVVVRGDRIVRIGSAHDTRIPKGAHIVDGRGKYLIPGLWDMHAHPFASQKAFFPLFALHLYLANGVTGLRDMFGPLAIERQWRTGIESGAIAGPRMLFGGSLVDGPKPAWPGSIAVGDAEAGRSAVRSQKSAGADFIKVYDLLPREAYFAIADEARKQGIPVAGHIPASVSAREASDAGQRSIEHLDLAILVACSTREEELRAEALRAKGDAEIDNSTALVLINSVAASALDSYSEEKARALFSRMRENGTSIVPTLLVFVAEANMANQADPRLKYLPRALREEWRPDADFLAAFSADDIALGKRLFPKYLQLVADMHRAGVRILAGTDSLGVPYCFPGSGVHDEMELLVKAGLTPMQALQAATRNPAEHLGLGDVLGTIEEGKRADLVLLDADPLAEIANIRKIAGVVSRGRLFDRRELDAMLEVIESAAK